MAKRAVVLNDTRPERHHGCTRVMRNLEAGLAAHGVQVVATGPVGRDWEAVPGLAPAMEGADLVVVNGEGTIHHDRPAGRRLVAAGAYAARAGVPAVLLNASWHSNAPALAEAARAFARIYVRESLSRDALAAHGVAAEVVPDLTFASGPFPGGPAAREGIAVTDSVDPQFAEVLYRLTRGGAGVRYLPVVAPFRVQERTGRELGRAARHAFFRAAGPWLEPFGWVRPRYVAERHALPTPEAYLAALARCRLVVAGRFHALCFALQTGTPFLAVPSNTPKVEGLLDDAGLGRARVVDPDALDAVDLAARAEEGFSDAEREAAARYVADAPGRIARMFADVAALEGGSGYTVAPERDPRNDVP